MLIKDPVKRITVTQIKEHPWTTDGGTCPMISTQENCASQIEVTKDDIRKAMKPAWSFASKVRVI